MLSEVPPGRCKTTSAAARFAPRVAVWILGIVPRARGGTDRGDPSRSALQSGRARLDRGRARRRARRHRLRRRAAAKARARVAVGVEALAILGGWFGAQAPALVPGRYTYVSAASSDAMIVAFLIATGAGFVVLVPSMLLLFRVFKRVPG